MSNFLHSLVELHDPLSCAYISSASKPAAYNPRFLLFLTSLRTSAETKKPPNVTTMRALAHLIRAHSVLSRWLLVREDATQCSPDIGSPGGVYLCGGHTDYCQWLSPEQTNVCVWYDVVEFGPPLLVGPDYGGACTLYSGGNCESDSKIVSALGSVKAASQKGMSGLFTCPGIEGRDIPVETRSFRCWAIKKESNVPE